MEVRSASVPPWGSKLVLSITLLGTALRAVGIFQNQEKVLNFKERIIHTKDWDIMTNNAGQ